MEKVYISFIRADGRAWKIKGNDRAVVEITPTDSNETCDENTITREASGQLMEYFQGSRKSFDFPLELTGTPFQQEVWLELQKIPYGTTVSYRDLAAAIGRPDAVRAVGQAVGKNPCLIVVPCHRVIGKNGSMTGFSAGVDLKRYLLELERK